MRKLMKGLTVAAVVAIAAAAIPTEAEAQATVVRSSGLCGINANAGFTLFACTIQTVTTPNGDVKVWIHGTVNNSAQIPFKAEKVDNASTGQFCTFSAPNFRGVITPGGQINLTCRS